MIFQQPMSCLNPVFEVGDQIAEVLDIHQRIGQEKGWERATELLKLVGVPEADKRAHSYPHELPGGAAQRVMIAMALACIPELLIADEPTTALDVTIQAQILDLLCDIRSKMITSIILITIYRPHPVVAEASEWIAADSPCFFAILPDGAAVPEVEPGLSAVPIQIALRFPAIRVRTFAARSAIDEYSCEWSDDAASEFHLLQEYPNLRAMFKLTHDPVLIPVVSACTELPRPDALGRCHHSRPNRQSSALF
jgi:hypothetical protein